MIFTVRQKQQESNRFLDARSMLHRDPDLIKRLSEAVMTVTTIWYFWLRTIRAIRTL